MSDPATSATGSSVSGLPGTFYSDGSFDHATFLPASQAQQPLHNHQIKTTLQSSLSAVSAASSPSSPLFSSSCRLHGVGRDASPNIPRVRHRAAVPHRRPIVAVTSTVEPSRPMHQPRSSSQTQPSVQSTDPLCPLRRNQTQPHRRLRCTALTPTPCAFRDALRPHSSRSLLVPPPPIWSRDHRGHTSHRLSRPFGMLAHA
jgi:hypothetical protein